MQSAVIMDGQSLSRKIAHNCALKLADLGNPKIVLATILIGDYAPSHLYVNLKMQLAEKAGLTPHLVKLPAEVSNDGIEDTLLSLADDSQIHGILLQLPLPEHLDTDRLLEMIPPEKDVDGLTFQSMGRLVKGGVGLAPCTPLGVMRLIKEYNITTAGRSAVVIGRSFLVGIPQTLLLSKQGVDATVTLCHSKTDAIEDICRDADIVVAATGINALIGKSAIKPGATVFDVGITQVDGKIVGDVIFDEVKEVAGAITPMPGGTGPMTVASLIENTIKAAQMQGVIESDVPPDGQDAENEYF
ncbi:MAG: bifunctional 5,10-methylenetetrahydrofolate dehydrogenase/5,10-methenyltetrahydrofolate cyclohydrolase [Chromatiales bacterium]|nr:bifunctional 5,10-methylenetetrahydrofolate dehydrogenase/5,10-methenyltetrahydrofolate cyclohydrolase [Chromatiales bacterium]